MKNRIIQTIIPMLFSMAAIAAPQPRVLNYQGRITVGNVNFNGSGQFKFAIVNATGDQTFWSNDGNSTGGSEPANAVPLNVVNGLYSVSLGDAPMIEIPAAIFTEPDVRLRVWFNDGGPNGSQPLAPDQRIASVGHAFVAGRVEDGAITGAQIANGSIGSAQIASGLTLGGTTSGAFSGDGSGLMGLQASSLTGVLTVDAGGPAPLGNISQSQMSNLGEAREVATVGNYAYLANFSDGFRIIDVSNPQAPVLRGHVPESLMGGVAFGVTVSGSYAYLANSNGGLRIINISDPQAPALTGHYPQPAQDGMSIANGVAVSGSYAYLANGLDGLRVINISVPSNPQLAGHLPLSGGYGFKVVVSGNYAYLAHSFGGLRVIDISNPLNPQLVGQVLQSQMGNGLAYGIAVAGSYAYVANGEDGLRIIDISDPQNPQLSGHVPESQLGNLFNRSALGVTVAGGYAYLANNNDGLRIINISNPQNPQLTGHIPESQLGNANARQAAVAGNYAYLANNLDGMRIVNIGNGAVRTNEADILFRRTPDGNHGVGWYGTSSPFPKLFAGAEIDGPVLYGYGGGALGSTEAAQTIALRWNPTGKVGIGGRAPAANTLEVEGNASKTAAGSWLANSDRRIKEDIQPISQALEMLDRVRLVDFRYTEDYRAAHPGIDGRRYLNVVAQEFAEVFPEHVKSSGEKLPDGSDILQVDTYPLTIYSAAAVQELHTKLKQKDTDIIELKARLEKLEALILKETTP